MTLLACEAPPRLAEAGPAVERVQIDVPSREIPAVLRVRSDENAYFSYITGVAVGPDESIYVGDFFQAAITVLSPGGDLVRTIGRSGEGPGEFRSVQGLQAFAGGDSLLVFDRARSRLSVFELGSEVPARISNLADHTQVFPMDVWRLSSGEILADFGAAYTPRDDPRVPRMRLLRKLDAEGYMVRDSLVSYPENDRLVLRDGGRLRVAAHPFGRTSEVRIGPNGTFVVAWSGDSKVRVYGSAGELRRTIPIGHPLQEIRPADVRKAAESMDEPKRRVLHETVPEHWPEFKYLQVDGEGRIWLAPYEGGGGATRWTVLDSLGTPLARVRFPFDADIRLIQGGRIYATATDSLDVPHIYIFTLQEPLP